MAASSFPFDKTSCANVEIARVSLAAYDLPLARTWASARGTLERRRGWLLRLESRDGALGFGECAPLPGAGTESFDDARSTLRTLLPSLARKRGDAVLSAIGRTTASPAAHCAVETAVLDLAAAAADRPLAKYLNPDAVESVAVNAMIGALDPGVARRAQQAVAAGYRILKLKLGVAPPEAEVAALHELAQGLPTDVALRLDANRAWDEATGRSMIPVLSGLPIEGLEEPLEYGSPQTLRVLQALAPWPLALDESLAHSNLSRLLDDPPVRRLVLKPMVVGGPLGALEIAARAQEAGIEVIITTTVDSAVGTFAALHTAAALAGNSTHGLATSSWLAQDLANPPVVTLGRMSAGARSGLGAIPFQSIYFGEVNDV